jgi:hypothetical protein
MEISQLRSGWLKSEKDLRPERTMEMGCVNVPPSFQDGMILRTRYQPQCGWLISGCPFGTKRSTVRRGIVVASKTKQGFKLRQERNMPPRLPRRNEMEAGRGWLAAP